MWQVQDSADFHGEVPELTDVIRAMSAIKKLMQKSMGIDCVEVICKDAGQRVGVQRKYHSNLECIKYMNVDEMNDFFNSFSICGCCIHQEACGMSQIHHGEFTCEDGVRQWLLQKPEEDEGSVRDESSKV